MNSNNNKILIVGCGGAGKSTLATALGEKVNLPVIHLDKLYWLPNWIERSNEEFDKLVEIELHKQKWIIDGNYLRTLEWRLKYADLCIFLDYNIDLCLQGVQERVIKYQGKSRPDMTDGCPEQVDSEFIEWINNYSKDVKPKLLDTIQNSNVPYLIFTSREETANWLNKINKNDKIINFF